MIDVDTLSEVYLVMKEYIPSKERQAVADHVVSSVADLGITEKDLKVFGGTDSYLGRAVKEYMGDEEQDEDEDYDE